MTLVVDSSVACKWFLDEPHSEFADLLLSGGDVLVAPDLIIPEVCNVAWRRLRQDEITAEQASSMVEDLPGMLDRLFPSVHLARAALTIAREAGHPAYDCFYIALAELSEAPLVTADRRLVGRFAGSRWGHLIRELGVE